MEKKMDFKFSLLLPGWVKTLTFILILASNFFIILLIAYSEPLKIDKDHIQELYGLLKIFVPGLFFVGIAFMIGKLDSSRHLLRMQDNLMFDEIPEAIRRTPFEQHSQRVSSKNPRVTVSHKSQSTHAQYIIITDYLDRRPFEVFIVSNFKRIGVFFFFEYNKKMSFQEVSIFETSKNMDESKERILKIMRDSPFEGAIDAGFTLKSELITISQSQSTVEPQYIISFYVKKVYQDNSMLLSESERAYLCREIAELVRSVARFSRNESFPFILPETLDTT